MSQQMFVPGQQQHHMLPGGMLGTASSGLGPGGLGGGGGDPGAVGNFGMNFGIGGATPPTGLKTDHERRSAISPYTTPVAPTAPILARLPPKLAPPLLRMVRLIPHAQARHWQHQVRVRSREDGRRLRNNPAHSSSMAPMAPDPLHRPRPLSHVTAIVQVLVVPTQGGVGEEVAIHRRVLVRSGRMAHRVRIL